MDQEQKIVTDEKHTYPTLPSPVLNPSYQRKTPFVMTDAVRKAIAGAVAEIDVKQLRLLHTKPLAERVEMAASMIEGAEQVGAYCLRQREPELSEDEALRIVRGGILSYYIKKRRKS
jgi:hypothetical protein